MNKTKLINRIYYNLKPLIPRRGQIWLRRKAILRKRKTCLNLWPIDEEAKKHPEGWKGWPDGKQFALVLTHDVETAKGQEKLYQMIELEKELGFRSLFNFVPERYNVLPEIRNYLVSNGFEVGVHGLCHDGKYFNSRKTFRDRAKKINNYLKEWNAVGYRTPSMLSNLEWFHDLNIEYDASTFDTDPFEPQSDGMGTIFPFWVSNGSHQGGYVELPYTLPQDFTLFILMKEKTIDIWKRKLDWIIKHGGMVLMITHPDYMNFDGKIKNEEYPSQFYKEILEYIKIRFKGQYWNVTPKEISRFWISK